jgi:hypothetical protein
MIIDKAKYYEFTILYPIFIIIGMAYSLFNNIFRNLNIFENMQLRYSANLIPPVDGMQKVSAIAWAPNGKKFAVATADRVITLSYTVCTHIRLIRS